MIHPKKRALFKVLMLPLVLVRLQFFGRGPAGQSHRRSGAPQKCLVVPSQALIITRPHFTIPYHSYRLTVVTVLVGQVSRNLHPEYPAFNTHTRFTYHGKPAQCPWRRLQQLLMRRSFRETIPLVSVVPRPVEIVRMIRIRRYESAASPY